MGGGAEEIARSLGGARKSGDGWMARCPAHDDKTPSLSLTDGEGGKLLYRCHAGCSQDEVRDAFHARGLLEERPRTERRSVFHIAKLGDPSQTFMYKSAHGGVAFVVARYESASGKEIRPWRPAASGGWECKAAEAPRVLYRLSELLADEAKPVLLVEGEKCANAAASALGSAYAVTCWSGGVKAIKGTDFKPLAGRSIVLWPDADEPGRAAMQEIARRLSGNGVGARIKVLDVAGRPEGWDIADAIAEGWSESDLVTFIDEHAREAHALADPVTATAGVGHVSVTDSVAAPKEKPADALWPAPLDLAALALAEPKRPHHIIADWLPAGEVTLFAGHGGSGKSLVALHLAACLTLGRAWWGLPVEQKRVLYISAEDAASVLTWRITRIAAHLGVALPELAGLGLIDAANREAELLIDPGRGDAPSLTALYDALAPLMSSYDVLVLDGASDLFGASEIQRRPVRMFLRALRRLVREDGAVILLAHMDKAAVRDKSATDRYTGSTAWNNSVRSRWSLDAEGDATLTLKLAKANHARAGAEFTLRWDEQAHLYVADPQSTEGGIVGAIRERQERDALLATMRACNEPVPAAMTGPRTALHVLSVRPEFPAALQKRGEGVRAFWKHVETLRAMGLVREDVITRKDRHKVRVLVASVIEESASAGNAGNA